MNPIRQFTISKVTFKLVVTSLAIGFIITSRCLFAGQATSEEMLSRIMDLHKELVTNEVFLAQAKMLGTYLEAAQPLEETKKVEIYSKVLDILTNIKASGTQVSVKPPKDKGQSEQNAFEEEQKGKNVFVPGAALLEIFKADSIETIPKLPVIRTYWERDLAYSGGFLLPDRFSEIGKETRYVARFSFYYEAKEPGDYGFTIVHNEQGNAAKLTVGGVDIVKVNRDSSGQGVCNLKKGFHRLEFWLVSAVVDHQYRAERDRPRKDRSRVETVFEGSYSAASFEIKVLTPDALDAVPLTKDMMLLKKE